MRSKELRFFIKNSSVLFQCYRFVKRLFNRGRVIGKKKVFVVGLNKTGTTTMAKALTDLGYVLGSEKEAKCLFYAWKKREFQSIIRFCKPAQAFQDSPFSYTLYSARSSLPRK